MWNFLIVALCLAVALRIAARQKYKNFGYVYFIENGGMIKIGCATNLRRRLQNFRTTMPFLKVIKVERAVDRFKLESYYHKKFAKYHITHEWYEAKIRGML